MRPFGKLAAPRTKWRAGNADRTSSWTRWSWSDASNVWVQLVEELAFLALRIGGQAALSIDKQG